MINKLTSEQKAQMSIYRDKWIAIGLSTDPANRELAEEGIRNSYRMVNCNDKIPIVWLSCPVDAVLLLGIMDYILQGKVEVKITDKQEKEIIALANKLASGSKPHMLEMSPEMIHESLASLFGRLPNKKSKLLDLDRHLWNTTVYAQHEAGWLSFYDFFEVVIGIDFRHKLDGVKQVAQNAGWWWPLETFCIVTDRPAEIHRDERGRLHSPTGKSISYRDGWGLYHWHGVSVPSYVIEHPEEITVSDIENESNAEVARVKVEQYGFGKFIHNSGTEMVHMDHTGKLYRKKQKNDEDLVMLEVEDATPEPDGSSKKYFIRVPPEMKTAIEAKAWTLQLTVEEVNERLIIET